MMSFCVVPWSAAWSTPLLLGGDDVEREQPRRRRVDRHRRVHLVERDAVHQRVHVAVVGDRHADLADLAAGELVVGVVAGLRRQVEGDREAGLALGEVAAVQLVGLLRGRMPRVGAHHPRPVALGQAVLAHGHGLYGPPPGAQARHRPCEQPRCGCARSTRATPCRGRRDRLTPPRRLEFVGHSDFAATGDEFLAHFVELGGLQPDERVLDVGCGIGRMARPLAGYLSRDGLLRRLRRQPRRHRAGAGGATGATPNFRFQVADLFNARYNPRRRPARRRVPLPVRRRRASTSSSPRACSRTCSRRRPTHYLAECRARAGARRAALRDVLPAQRRQPRAAIDGGRPGWRSSTPTSASRSSTRSCPRRRSPTTTSGCSRRCATNGPRRSTAVHPGSWSGRDGAGLLPGHRGARHA